jgi:hypothetical protein
MNIINIITEEYHDLMSEAFDANVSSYEWTKDYENNDYYYEFITDDNDKYYVDIENDTYEGAESWVISFTVGGYKYEDTVNKGKIFRVMATIINIIKDFINNVDPEIITIIPSKKNPEDNRRLNMYMGYIKKHLPSNYDVKIDYDLSNPEIVLSKKNM